MAPLRIRTIALRVLLGLYRGVGSFARGAVLFFGWIGRGLWKWGGRFFILPLAHVLYRSWLVLNLRARSVIRTLRMRVFGSLLHRHMLHMAMIAIVLFTATLSVATGSVRAEDLGTRSIFYSLVSGTDTNDEIVEDTTVPRSTSAPAATLPDQVAVSPGTPAAVDFIDIETATGTIGSTGVRAGQSQIGPGVAPRTSIVKYTVQPSDTISDIADNFGLDIASVLWANKLTVHSFIKPGDTLTIPPTNGVIYTITRGDTVARLADHFNANPDDIVVWNGLTPDAALQVGDTIFIPEGSVPTPVVPRRVSPPVAIFTGPEPEPFSGAVPTDKMCWPVASYRITQYFLGRRHTGVDIGAVTGTPTYAADDGIVEFVGWTKGYGNNTVINHGNGLHTRYGHSSKLLLRKGDVVKKCQLIQLVGSTGHSTGPHLHFEVFTLLPYKQFHNPLQYIR